jgi:hypothetical protein
MNRLFARFGGPTSTARRMSKNEYVTVAALLLLGEDP